MPIRGHILDPSTLSLWRFDEPVGPNAGEATGTYAANFAGNAPEPGLIGHARRPTATGYGTAPGDAAAVSALLGDWTIEALVLRTPGAAVTSYFLSYSGNETGAEQLETNTLAAVGVGAGLEIVYLAEYGSGTDVTASTAPGVFPAGRWTHLAVRKKVQPDLTATIDFFLDGNQVGTSPGTTNAAGGTSSQWFLGAHGGSPFPGLVDEIRVSNVARTNAEIRDSALRSLPVPSAGPRAFWPIEVMAGLNDAIDFQVNGVSYVAKVPAQTYLEPVALELAVADALNSTCRAQALASHARWWCRTSTDGRVAIGNGSATGAAYKLLWSTGASITSTLRDVLGFDAVDVGFTAGSWVSGAHQHPHGWYGELPATDDTGDLPLYSRAQPVALSGAVKSLSLGARYRRSVTLAHLPGSKLLIAEEGTDHPNEALQRLFDEGWRSFRWWSNASDDSIVARYALDLETAKDLPRTRISPGFARYGLTLKLDRIETPLRQETWGNPQLHRWDEPGLRWDSSRIIEAW